MVLSDILEGVTFKRFLGASPYTPYSDTIPLVKGEMLLESLAQICKIRVCMGFGEFWKVMEISNAIFQNLKSFGKETFFKIAMEKFWIFVCENAEIS